MEWRNLFSVYNSPSACLRACKVSCSLCHLLDLQSQATQLPKPVQLCNCLFCKWKQKSFLTHSSDYIILTILFFHVLFFATLLLPSSFSFIFPVAFCRPSSPISFLHSSPIYCLSSITGMLSPSFIRDPFYWSIPAEWQAHLWLLLRQGAMCST